MYIYCVFCSTKLFFFCADLSTPYRAIMRLSMLAPITPLPGEVRQSWGFDIIRIQLPHPPGNVRIQIPPSYTGSERGFDGTRTACVSHAHFTRFNIPTPGASLPIQTRKILHLVPGGELSAVKAESYLS